MARHRALTIIGVILFMLMAPLVTSPVSAVRNERYVSHTLEFSLDWDDSWAVIDESADLLSESITLSNETSTVTFRALLGFGGDSQLCLDYVEDEFTEAPEFDIAGEISGGLTEPLSGESRTAAFSLYRLEADNDADGSSLLYLDCRTLVPGESVLVGKIMTPGGRWHGERSDLRDLWQSVEVFRSELPAKRDGVSPVATAAEWFANDVDAFWTREFDDADLTFRPPTYRVFGKTMSSPCGDLWPGVAALYCGLDAGVYLDERWISLHVLPEYGVTGVAYLLAHETAHSVQFQRDILITSRRQELQADCLAGAYLQTRVEAGVVQAGAVENLATLIHRGGDDAVSNLIGTDSYLESHGTGQQRLTLFRRGYEVGIEGCGLELNGRD